MKKGLMELGLCLGILGLWTAAAIACTPTLWTAQDLTYNLQQLNEEAQSTPVLHLYSARDGYTGYGQFITGFRFVCYKAVLSAPAGCELPSQFQHPKLKKAAVEAGRRPASGGSGPGPCYIQVVDWGTNFGADLSQASCEAQSANLGMLTE